MSRHNPATRGRLDPLKEGLDSPWKLTNTVLRLVVLPYARMRFAIARIEWGRSWQLFGTPIVQRHRQSTIALGDRLSLRSTVRSNPLGPTHAVILSTRKTGAEIRIGEDFAMTGGSIVAQESVVIGDRVTVGADCVIADTDFHPLDPHERIATPTAGRSSGVVIEDDVFLGMRSIVLKGVTVGRATVVGAGSVVTHSLPERVIAAGNPAEVISKL